MYSSMYSSIPRPTGRLKLEGVKFDPRSIIRRNLKEVHPRNIPEKFHQNWTSINAQTRARRTQDHDISPADLWPSELSGDFQKDKFSDKFYKDLAITMASNFKGTNVLTKFHKDLAMDVVSRGFT
ncbi:hypothetical protein DPMN_150010 [Dreissena polymorpha]|uniref:Uncharacterized protein n=1 Tax=Dreissena polymorpha TaxID=45954 RepID=A0A9D4FIH3_DREPO|nr:hypothetical protein DPMN_150010 [Dreissena polymorpha]